MDYSGFHSPGRKRARTGCVSCDGSIGLNEEYVPGHLRFCEYHKEAKFSTLLTAPCMAVIAQSIKPKTFYLHELLLCHESKYFLKYLNGHSNKSATRSTCICDEDPELFGHFVEYLYRDGWVCSPGIKDSSEYVTLASLYAMGARLGAEKFQQAVLWKFSCQFPCTEDIPDQCVCHLLLMVCTELPERSPEDPLRALVFWYASTRLEKLSKHVEFKHLLFNLPDLARQLCQRAGNAITPQPENKTSEPHTRFKAEEQAWK